MPAADQLHHILQTRHAPEVLEVIDESAQHAGHAGSDGRTEGSHLRVRISAAALGSGSRVDKHRLVYDAARPLFAQGLHALAIEWA
jgi:BolA protein